MAKDTESLLVEMLRSKNTSRVNDALLYIRKQYVRNPNKLRKLQNYHFVENVIPYLEHPKFCETSLSIVMEGCLELDFVKDVIKHEGLQCLNRIMQSGVNDAIHTRACRALGNIAKFTMGYTAVHSTVQISNIVHFLSGANDADSQKAAIRTLTILAKSAKTRELIAEKNGIVYIAKLLHTSNVDVLISSTEALANLTQNCTVSCAEKLLDEQYLQAFVNLYSHSERRVRNNILILLQNLCTQEKIRSNLIKAGAVRIFTEVLSLNLDEMVPTAALALCSCLDHLHMWSHNGTDRAIGLKALVLVLQNKHYQKLHCNIITSLIPLSYESKTGDILLNLDLLPVLTEILKDFIEKNKCKSLAIPKSESVTRRVVAVGDGSRSVVYERPVTQKESNFALNSHFESSETLRKKLKVENVTNFQSGGQSVSVGKVENLGLNKFISNDYKSKAKQLNENPELKTIDHYTVLFILQLSFHTDKNPNSQIADKSCFSVLMDYLWFIHNPSYKAQTVLLNLVKNRYCFEKLILNGFICELGDKLERISMYDNSSNCQSNNFTCSGHSYVKVMYSNLIQAGRQEAQSDYGVGTICHILTTSERTGQLYAICAFAKLVSEKSALYRLLFQANGLSLLLNFLSDSSVITRRMAIISMCEIYQSLAKDKNDKTCCFLRTCKLKQSRSCAYASSSFDVTFTVDCGAKVYANREIICRNSEYFNALLSANFLEGRAESVPLPEISAENLMIILHFLHGCASDTRCPYISLMPFSVASELLPNCDRFLLLNMKGFVEDRLCHFLHPLTVPEIYRVSKFHNSPALARRSLNFALNLDLFEKDTVWKCFEELLQMESNLHVVGDIESLVRSIF